MVPPENVCALWKSYPTVGSKMFVFNDENLWNISNLRILRLSVIFLSSNDKLEKKLPPFPNQRLKERMCSQSSLSWRVGPGLTSGTFPSSFYQPAGFSHNLWSINFFFFQGDTVVVQWYIVIHWRDWEAEHSVLCPRIRNLFPVFKIYEAAFLALWNLSHSSWGCKDYAKVILYRSHRYSLPMSLPSKGFMAAFVVLVPPFQQREHSLNGDNGNQVNVALPAFSHSLV